MIASVLLLSAKIAFLIQYYILLWFIVVRNIYRKIFSLGSDESSIFSHPKEAVHPHVFSHTCKILVTD